MAYNAVFVVEAIVRAGIVRALNKACHFVLVEVDKTDIAVELIVIDVVRAGLAVRCIFHIHSPYVRDRASRLFYYYRAGKAMLRELGHLGSPVAGEQCA